MKLGLIKFKYGEEILTQYEKITGGFNIKNSATLLPTENFHWHLVTWMPYTKIKDGFFLPDNEVWFVAEPSNDMVDYYNKWLAALLQGRYIEESDDNLQN